MPSTLPFSYSSVSLMMLTLPELSSLTTLTSLHMATYGSWAQADVDAHIIRNYVLPLSGEVPVLQRITTDMGVYYTLRRVYTQDRITATAWPDRFKEAMAQLAQIGDGELPLVSMSGAVFAARTDFAPLHTTTMNYVPTFHEGPWETMIQDAQKIDDILNARDFGPFGTRVRLA